MCKTDALWVILMDECRKHGIAPASCNSLFKLCQDFREIETDAANTRTLLIKLINGLDKAIDLIDTLTIFENPCWNNKCQEERNELLTLLATTKMLVSESKENVISL